MSAETIRGKQSISFREAPHIVSRASIVGKKEGEGPLGNLFDRVEEDPMLGQASWEGAESALQKQAARLAMEKAGPGVPPVRYLFSGDLLGQLIATSFGVMDLKLPLFGLYGACSTIGEALMLGAMTVQGGYSDAVLALTSSHFGSAEKQFRFPEGEVFPDEESASRLQSKSLFFRLHPAGCCHARGKEPSSGEIGARIGLGSAPAAEEERFIRSQLHAHVFQLFRRGVFPEHRCRRISGRHAEQKKGQHQDSEHNQNGIGAAAQNIANHWILSPEVSGNINPERRGAIPFSRFFRVFFAESGFFSAKCAILKEIVIVFQQIWRKNAHFQNAYLR